MMVIDRAEGTSSSDASGNPSAVSFSIPKSYFRLLEDLDGQGFKDALPDYLVAIPTNT